MSEELTIKRGTAAQDLLTSEAFITCVNDLYNQYFAEITNSALGATDVRENRFFQLRALQDISTELQSWVQAKDQLLTPTEE